MVSTATGNRAPHLESPTRREQRAPGSIDGVFSDAEHAMKNVGSLISRSSSLALRRHVCPHLRGSPTSFPATKRTASFRSVPASFHFKSGSVIRAMTSSGARLPPSETLCSGPPDGKYKLALCQLSVTADKVANIAHARQSIEAAASEGAQLIVLPEMWNCPYSNASFPEYAEETDNQGGDTPSSKMLSDVARKNGVTIIGGSIPERSEGRLYNTCYIYGTKGELKGKHRKVHLFDIDIPGKITFKESDTLTPGESLTIVDTDVGRIGVGICYDIRFPEMAMLYAARGVHMICYPGAFNMTTGPLHWELLTKARAVDNQLYVITCSPARNTEAGYVAWGHSTIVGPFGEIVATTEHAESTVYGEIDYSKIKERRLNMPLEHLYKTLLPLLYPCFPCSRCDVRITESMTDPTDLSHGKLGGRHAIWKTVPNEYATST
ncbi:hypothetical protein R1flu_017410 [Riccia fluitans]|uniref:CN hydrolase domain-containing protein n=1 Tax=Riccia fluitans TaxID=41844 RepID=A0ABD1ZDY1_9MARC